MVSFEQRRGDDWGTLHRKSHFCWEHKKEHAFSDCLLADTHCFITIYIIVFQSHSTIFMTPNLC